MDKKAVLVDNSKKNPFINYIYSVLHKVLSLIIPLLTTPYITSVLGAERYGEYSFVSTIAVYFVLFASLGFATYGERKIAQHRTNLEEKSKTFWETFFSRIILVSLSAAVYLIVAFCSPYGQKYSTLVFIRALSILAIVLDTSFLFTGDEDFLYIFIPNLITKLLGLASVFLFVKTSNDVWIYALIIEAEAIISFLILFPFVLKRVNFIRPKIKGIWVCIKDSFLLFLPTIAISIYPVLDKSIIGILSDSDSYVGVYNKSQQLIDSITAFTFSLGIVLSPRNSYLVENNKKEEFKHNIRKSLDLTLMFCIPAVLGIVALAYHFCSWFVPDPSFADVPLLISIMAPIILFASVHNILSAQYLVPMKKDKTLVVVSLLALVINASLSIAGLYLFNTVGVAVASVITEIIGAIILIVVVRKEIDGKELIVKTLIYLLAGGVMFTACFFLSKLITPSVLTTFLIVLVGIVLYFGVLLLFKNKQLLIWISLIKERFLALNKKLDTSVKYKKFLNILLFACFFFSALSYAPIALRFSLNKIVYVLWGVLLIAVLITGFRKVKDILMILLKRFLPFIIFVVLAAIIVNKSYLLNNFTKVIFISFLVMCIGMISSNKLDSASLKYIFRALIIANTLVSLDIFFEYFRNFSFDTVNYVYAGKNAVATNILLSIWIALFSRENNKYLRIGYYASAAFMFALLLMLKCRAALVVVPFIVIIECFNEYNSDLKRKILIGFTLGATSLVLIVPPLRELVIEKILFANHSYGGLDTIASGRLSYIFDAWNIYVLSPVFGIGEYYVDFAPLCILCSFGAVGLVLLSPIFVLLFRPFKYKTSKNIQFYNFYAILLLIFTINTLFEAYSPFGPGVKTFCLWFFLGALYKRKEDGFSKLKKVKEEINI